MSKQAVDQAQEWRSYLTRDCPEQSAATSESIVRWLIGNQTGRWEQINPKEQTIVYRYQILRQRYLGLRSEQAYRNLLERLGSLVLLTNKIRAWVAAKRDRQQVVVDVLQEVLQELLISDRYIQQQIAWIAECSNQPILRNALLLATLEEYCLRPIRNQPLLIHKFIDYLHRMQNERVNQMPHGITVQLISKEIFAKDSEQLLSY